MNGRPSRFCGKPGVLALALLGGGCAAVEPPPPATNPPLAPLVVDRPVLTTAPPVVTAAPQPLVYTFPFTGRVVSYGHEHHDYPATDVFGCGATVLAPIWGTVGETRTDDPWDPAVDSPATRGGIYVTILGGDGVRYYFAHLASVAVEPGDAVDAGTPLGVMGQTGNARQSDCHTHMGISRLCPNPEWAVRRGEVYPWPFLDAWRMGDAGSSPALAVYDFTTKNPDACEFAASAPEAGDA